MNSSVNTGCHRKILEVGASTTGDYFSQLWRLEVQGQGDSGIGFWRDPSSRLVDGRLLAVSSRGFSSMVREEDLSLCLFLVRALVPS